MIFIVLFLFVGFVIISLNMFNASNIDEVKNYLIEQNCVNKIYSKGSYKALCEDRLLEISNSFKVDIENNSREFKYNEIKNLSKTKLDILINDEYKVSFKDKEEVDSFYKNLEKKIKN